MGLSFGSRIAGRIADSGVSTKVRMSEVTVTRRGLSKILSCLASKLKWLYLLATFISSDSGTGDAGQEEEQDYANLFKLPALSLLALTIPKPRPNLLVQDSAPALDPETSSTMLEIMRTNAATLTDLMLYTLSLHPKALEPFSDLAVSTGISSQLGFLGVLGSGGATLLRNCTKLKHLQIQLTRLTSDDRSALEAMNTLEFLRLEDDFVHIVFPHGDRSYSQGLRTLKKVIGVNAALEVVGINQRVFALDRGMDQEARDLVQDELNQLRYVAVGGYADTALVIFAKRHGR